MNFVCYNGNEYEIVIYNDNGIEITEDICDELNIDPSYISEEEIRILERESVRVNQKL